LNDSPRRLGLIGCGRIALPVIEARRRQQLRGWQLDAVLSRYPRQIDGVHSTIDPEQFFARGHDLIVELAGPRALALYA